MHIAESVAYFLLFKLKKKKKLSANSFNLFSWILIIFVFYHRTNIMVRNKATRKKNYFLSCNKVAQLSIFESKLIIYSEQNKKN